GTDRQRIVEAPAVIEQAYPEEAVPADVLKLDACTEILMLRQRTARADLEVRRCRCRGGSSRHAEGKVGGHAILGGAGCDEQLTALRVISVRPSPERVADHRGEPCVRVEAHESGHAREAGAEYVLAPFHLHSDGVLLPGPRVAERQVAKAVV